MTQLIRPYCRDEINHIFHKNPSRRRLYQFRKFRTGYSDFSKILEKIVATQINNYLGNFNILPSSPPGYSKGYSTHSALLRVVQCFPVGLNNFDLSTFVLLVQSKAFGLVNFKMLLAKLQYLCFSFTEVKRFQTHRSQRSSPLRHTTSGVPQGNILEPILFALYIFDLIQCTKRRQYTNSLQLTR